MVAGEGGEAGIGFARDDKKERVVAMREPSLKARLVDRQRDAVSFSDCPLH